MSYVTFRFIETGERLSSLPFYPPLRGSLPVSASFRAKSESLKKFRHVLGQRTNGPSKIHTPVSRSYSRRSRTHGGNPGRSYDARKLSRHLERHVNLAYKASRNLTGFADTSRHVPRASASVWRRSFVRAVRLQKLNYYRRISVLTSVVCRCRFVFCGLRLLEPLSLSLCSLTERDLR